MASKTTYNFPNSAVRERVYTISDFRGVDYSKLQLKLSSNHASDILNFVRRDGINQKRYGWEEIISIPEIKYYVKENDRFYPRTNPVKVNGVWSFVGEDGKNHIVAHVGNILVEISSLSEDVRYKEIIVTPLTSLMKDDDGYTYNVTIELSNQESSAFVGSNRLYILGGNDFFLLRFNKDGTFKLCSLRDADEVFVPTTTIGITYKDSVVSGRSPLDDTNMLTPWRKNKLVSGTGVSEDEVRTTRFFEFELDTSIKHRTQEDLNNIEVTIETLNLGGKENE